MISWKVVMTSDGYSTAPRTVHRGCTKPSNLKTITRDFDSSSESDSDSSSTSSDDYERHLNKRKDKKYGCIRFQGVSVRNRSHPLLHNHPTQRRPSEHHRARYQDAFFPHQCRKVSCLSKHRTQVCTTVHSNAR